MSPWMDGTRVVMQRDGRWSIELPEKLEQREKKSEGIRTSTVPRASELRRLAC